jgi:predicted site-specific integrase-resolvase
MRSETRSAEALSGDHFVDVWDVARRAAVSAETVRGWIRRGKLLAYVTPTGRYRIPAAVALTVLKRRHADEVAHAQDVQEAQEAQEAQTRRRATHRKAQTRK